MPQQLLCYKLFTKKSADLYFGDSYTCLVNGTKFQVNIGNNWALVAGNILTYDEGSISLQDCPFTIYDSNAIPSASFVPSTTIQYTVSATSFTAIPSYDFNFPHATYALCKDLSFTIGNVYGLAKRPYTYLSYYCISATPLVNTTNASSICAASQSAINYYFSSWTLVTYSPIINSSFLAENCYYTFKTEIRNFLNTPGIQNASVAIRPILTPELTLNIQAYQQYVLNTTNTDGYEVTCISYRKNITIIQASAIIIPACGASPTYNASDFSYSLTQITANCINSQALITINGSVFIITAYSIFPNTICHFKVTATLKVNSNLNMTQYFALNALSDQVKNIINKL